VAAGGTVQLTGVQLTTAIPANIVTEIVNLLHLTSFTGTVATLDFDATGATPASVNGAGSGISFTIPFVAGQPAPLTIPSSPESIGPFTAGKSGTIVLSPGTIVITTIIGPLSYSIDCAPPSSLPAGAQASVAIVTSTSSSSTVATSSTIATSTSSTVAPTSTSGPGSTGPSSVPSTVPPSHTGEPWAGWPYWLIVSLLGVSGFTCFELALRAKRRRA
jgi:hypothetical protein